MIENKVFLQTVGRFIQAQVRLEIAPLRKQIEELKAECTELRKGGIRYCGIHQRAASYQCGDVITQDGAMWIAVTDAGPMEMPGKSAAWQLAVRAGRNGKDARP